MSPTDGPVLFYDAQCILCSRAIGYILKYEHTEVLQFASLQSAQGLKAKQSIIAIGKPVSDSIILWHKNKYYQNSQAVIQTVILMGGIGRLAYLLRIIPPFILNAVYRFIAAKRYTWWGRQDNCRIITPTLNERIYKD